MKYLDIIIQTVLLLLTFALLVPYSMSALLIGQFCIGVWQMLSSTISVVAGTPNKLLRRIHFALAVIFLIFMYTGLVEDSVLTFAIPWALALYYYTITWMWFLSANPKKGKFLPNTSF